MPKKPNVTGQGRGQGRERQGAGPAPTQDHPTVDLPLESLKPHPRNAALYRPRTPQEIEDLAQDMARNGQIEPVEVLPDGTMISGNGRWEAAMKLGWKTIRCWVRHDLAQAGAAAVEQRLIEANLCRRHLSRLDLVRSFEALLRVARNGRGRSRSDAEVRGDLRDLIARRFKPPVSGRTLDRWLQVLHMPLPIQDAVDSGRMKLTDALRVAALDPRVQAQVAGEI